MIITSAAKNVTDNTMNPELILTPTGRLRIKESDSDMRMPSDPWMKRVVSAFLSSQGMGLFSLCATQPQVPLSIEFGFWRDFASNYMTRLCQIPSSVGNEIDPVEAPVVSELATLALSAPPMQGGEYLGMDVFRNLWTELDTWTRKQIAESSGGLSEWLKKHAPMWRQVGRVCFHLAENKHDPPIPFCVFGHLRTQACQSPERFSTSRWEKRCKNMQGSEIKKR